MSQGLEARARDVYRPGSTEERHPVGAREPFDTAIISREFTDMSADTLSHTLERVKHLAEMKFVDWRKELVSKAKRYNTEESLSEARQMSAAIKVGLARHDNDSKARSPELAESTGSDVSQPRESHQGARGPFSMQSLGLALRHEPIKGKRHRNRNPGGQPFKIAKGAFSARSGTRSRCHKGDNGSFFSHSVYTKPFSDRIESFVGFARNGNSARTEVGSFVEHASLESGYEFEIPV